MKKPFKQIKVGKLFNSKVAKVIGSFISGSLAGTLKPVAGGIAGIAEGINQVKKDNLKSELGGSGKVNYIHLIGVLLSVLLLVGYLFDFISIEKLEFAIEFIEDYIK
jgi:hypothetical protein